MSAKGWKNPPYRERLYVEAFSFYHGPCFRNGRSDHARAEGDRPEAFHCKILGCKGDPMATYCLMDKTKGAG